MTPIPGEPSWFQGEPKSGGRYLTVDSTFWHDRTATWVPPNGRTPGKWYPDGGYPCDASGIAMFRPLPRIPPREPLKTVDDSRTRIQE